MHFPSFLTGITKDTVVMILEPVGCFDGAYHKKSA